MSRSAYRIDLSAQHAECEANYARLTQLLAPVGEKGQLRIILPGGHALQLGIAERFPYTVTVEVAAASPAGPGSAMPPLTVRMYHDARMAEVIACGDVRRPRPRYAYPNQQMFQPDEKEQWNRFLGEWLSYSLQFGRAEQDTVVPSCEL